MFARRHGYSPDDAQDLTQGFFLHLLSGCESGAPHGCEKRSAARCQIRLFLCFQTCNRQVRKIDSVLEVTPTQSPTVAAEMKFDH